MPATATLGRREAAEFLGVHKNTIRNLIKRGQLHPKAVKVNGVEEHRFAIEELTKVKDSRGATEVRHVRIPRLVDTVGNPEATRIWAAYEVLSEENQVQRNRITELETELRMTSARLVEAEKERKRLLDTVVKMTTGAES